ncbi:DMT family transporter [Marinoscillum furvescens]|uniref:EamA-like transporter family protein n=1 Tax=Marinoscillum furvescens DSM 4134 TaxID=1122208 RepID=A0A3D9L398_MARFU|nr:DMT family transporter [Marinoscillum furvescens]RED99576.1 EamA-like transporter family protein [Marinoscillum furvescens DSM 4134]
MTQKPTLKAWGLLIGLSLIWGSSFILIKKGLLGLTSMEVGSLRILSAALVLLPFAIKNLKKVKRAHLLPLISVGFVGSFLPAFLFAIAQTRLESSVTGVLNALTPLFTMLVGFLIYKQSQRPQVFLGIGVGFVGTALLVMAGSGGDLSSFNYYALFVIAATLMYALNLNVIKHHLHGLKSMTITSVSLLFVGPLAAIQLLFFSEFTTKLMTVDGTLLATGYILTLGIVGTAFALLIFNKLVSLTDPVFTSSVTYIIPIVAVCWGVLDGEVLLTAHVIGIALVLVGVFLANRAGRKARA